MERYIIRETTDFYPLSVLFHESGMGVKVEDQSPERIVKMWRMDDPETGELMAAATLEFRAGVAALGDIAVGENFRSHGYGAVMQKVVFEEARERGIREIWACAKEPEYYAHCGWQRMEWKTSPDIAVYCASCGKRGRECHPEIMRYTL